MKYTWKLKHVGWIEKNKSDIKTTLKNIIYNPNIMICTFNRWVWSIDFIAKNTTITVQHKHPKEHYCGSWVSLEPLSSNSKTILVDVLISMTKKKDSKISQKYI